MIKWPVFVVVLAHVLFGAGTAKADVLYFYDSKIGTDSMAMALSQWATAHPGTNIYSTNSDSTFATQLGTGKYSLAVFFVQDYYPSSLSAGVSALQAYVAAGGKAIVDDFATAVGSSFLTPFGAQFSGPTNKTQFTVTNPPLTPGTYNLTNPGWITNSTDLTPTTGVGAAYFTPGDPTTAAIVIGNGGRTILNGFLNDSFSDPNQGASLYTTELNNLESGSAPEPGSLTLLGIGAAGMGACAWRRRKRAA